MDPRRGDEMVRGAATLPHGTGKSVKVAVFATGTDAELAKQARRAACFNVCYYWRLWWHHMWSGMPAGDGWVVW